MPAESRLVKKIIRYVRDRGGWCEKVHGGPYQRVGLPDVLICFRGIFVMAETKAGTKATPAQLQVIKEINAAGGIAFVCTSVEQVQRILDNIDAWMNLVVMPVSPLPGPILSALGANREL